MAAMSTRAHQKILDNEKDFLIIGSPFYFIGGGQKRVYNMMKAFHELSFNPILYIPYQSLLISLVLEKIRGYDEAVMKILTSVEKYAQIPAEIYKTYSEIDQKITKHLKPYRKGGVQWILHNFLKTIEPDKMSIIYAKSFLESQHNVISKLSFVYTMDNFPDMIQSGAYLSKSLHKNFFILLQSPPFIRFKDLVTQEYLTAKLSKVNFLRRYLRFLIITQQYLLSKMKTIKMYTSVMDTLTALLSVSEAPFVESGVDVLMMERRIPTQIIKPGNAVEEELSIYCHEAQRKSLLKYKEDYAVFYARLGPSKGLFELPLIARKLQDQGYQVKMMGMFDSNRSMRIFNELCKKLGVKNIDYLGFLFKQELYDIVSKAKVLIYPSHIDSFSLVILEALFLGTSVVAYDIPAITSVYSELKPVRIVREYDYRKMAEEALKILKMDDSQYIEEHLDPYFQEFLLLHSSWKNVAKREIEIINELKKKS